MALRDKWEFDYKAAGVASAAAAKVKHHTERLTFWQEKQREVMADIKESGLEIEESLAGAIYSNAVYGPQVVIRNDYQKRLNECHAKIQEHESKVGAYGSYAEALKLNPNQTVSLHVDDILWFFGK